MAEEMAEDESVLVLPDEFKGKVFEFQTFCFGDLLRGMTKGDPIFMEGIRKFSHEPGAAKWPALFASWIYLLSAEESSAFSAAKPQFLAELLLFEQSDPMLRGLTYHVSEGILGEEA